MFYVVVDGNAYAMDHASDTPYGAPVNTDGSVDWDGSYDFNPSMDEEDQEYVAHVLYHLQKIAQLTEEHNNKGVFVK